MLYVIVTTSICMFKHNHNNNHDIIIIIIIIISSSSSSTTTTTTTINIANHIDNSRQARASRGERLAAAVPDDEMSLSLFLVIYYVCLLVSVYLLVY